MEHQPDCIIKIEAIGDCENCARRVRKKIVRLEGVHSVEIDREKRWVYIAGDVEPQLLMDYLTHRIVKPESVKLIYYCSKEAISDKHHGKNQTDNKSESHVKNKCHQKNMASDHAKNIPNQENCPMKNNSKREGENYNQDSSSRHTRGDHYAPRTNWVHRAENYVAQTQKQKQDQYPTYDCECSCDFHAWKRQGRNSRFDFDRVPRAANMRSASAQWFREESPLPFYEPIMPQFPYI